jgi:Ni/Co efflux regulator RcnB
MAEDHRGNNGGARREQGGGGAGRQALGRIFGGGREAARPQEYRPQEYRAPSRPPQDYRQPEYRQAEPRGQQEYRPEAYRGEAADPRYGYRSGGQAYPGPAYQGQAYAAPRDPRYDPRVYAPPPSAYSTAPRRGGYMGEGAPVVGDYAARRLRAPPPGYDWMQTPRGYALVSRSTHQVFDVVPY